MLIRRNDTRSRGFTLIELIVTIVILGILAALAIPSFSSVIERSRDRSAEETWASVLRSAQALASFEERDVTVADITTSLADLTAADQAVLADAGAPLVLADGAETYTYDDGDSILTAGEWIVDDVNDVAVLAAAPSALTANGRLIVSTVPAPGTAPIVEARDYDRDADDDGDATDTTGHLGDPPTADGGGQVAASELLLTTYTPESGCATTYFHYNHAGGQQLTVTGSELTSVGIWVSHVDAGGGSAGSVPIQVDVYKNHTTHVDELDLLHTQTTTVAIADNAWLDVALTSNVAIPADGKIMVEFTATGWDGNRINVCYTSAGLYAGGYYTYGGTIEQDLDAGVRVHGTP